MKPIKYLLIAFLFNAVCILESHAANIVAAGCDSASIQAKLNIAVSGDTVWFPSGFCNSIWSSGVTISTSGVTLSGRTTGCPSSCVDNTNISGSGTLISIRASNVRVTGITLTSGGDIITAHITGGGLSNWRIDHSHFNGTVPGRDIVVGAYGATGESIRKDYPAVIDHNLFTSTNSHKMIQQYGGSGSYSDWNDTLTLGGSSFLFVEDNKFISSALTSGISTIDTDSGGRIVIRYNTFTNNWINGHGQENQGPDPSNHTSVHAFEVYGNTFDGDVVSGQSEPYWIRSNYRGGTGVFHHNNFNMSRSTLPLLFQYYRGDVSGYCTGSYACTGSNSYDGNQTGTNGNVCYQQPGSTGAGHPSVSSPIYEWSNTWGGTPCSASGECIGVIDECGYHHVQKGRDIVSSGTTTKPGYSTYIYPHPLTTSNVPTMFSPQPQTKPNAPSNLKAL